MDLNKEIMKEYRWYDYTYFLRLMRLWLDDASYQHKTNGISLYSNTIARKMQIMSLLLERLEKDDYNGDKLYMEGKVTSELIHWKVSPFNCRVQGVEWEEYKEFDGQMITTTKYTPDYATYKKRLGLSNNHNKMQRQQDKDLFARMFSKYLDRMWD